MQGSERAVATQRWVDVATERGSDAAALDQASRHVASVYMLGYVVEALAKGLSTAMGVTPKKTHDIIAILEGCGFRRQDLPPDIRRFAETRVVDSRYEVRWSPSLDYLSEYAAGLNLARWLKVRFSRGSGQPRRRHG